MIEPNVSLVVTFGGLWLLWLAYMGEICNNGIRYFDAFVLNTAGCNAVMAIALKRQLNFGFFPIFKGHYQHSKQDPSSFSRLL